MLITAKRGLRTTLLITIVLIAALLVSTLATNPDRLGPFGITLWFVGLLFALGGILTIVFYHLKRMFVREDKALVFTHALRQGILAATWLTALIALNSLRSLSLKDIVLVTILVALIEFYLRRATA
ncbi:hypothetical protein HY441_00800 [Candidatus Microgenomates bacterium]|nr:hypothetical protein [Candidatus Microgenomates bacterium]